MSTIPVASDTPILLVENQGDCHQLASPKNAKFVAVISEHFPVVHLPLLETTIATELNKPQELRSFEVANLQILPQLRRRKQFHLQTAQALDSRIARCNKLVDKLVEIENESSSIGIAVELIEEQISLMTAVAASLSQERLKLRSEQGI